MNDPQSISPFKITICGVGELDGHVDAKVSHVLSILDPLTPEPEALEKFGRHARLRLDFHDVIEYPVIDQLSPQVGHIEALLAFGRDAVEEPQAPVHLLVHCYMGISRSTAAAALLLCQSHPNRPATEIVAEIARIRPKAWPNLRMIELGDAILGRNGELVNAVRDRHRQMAGDFPQVARFMRDCGRARELIGFDPECA
jgi:predicted protein tyrosine phosphatase